MLVEQLAERQPLLLVFEDVHWADDALLDLIDYLVSHVRDTRSSFLALAQAGVPGGRPDVGRRDDRPHDAARSSR